MSCFTTADEPLGLKHQHRVILAYFRLGIQLEQPFPLLPDSFALSANCHCNLHLE